MLLQERTIETSAAWRQAMGVVDVSVLQHMRDNIKDGFDEERHGPRVGFGNLKRCVRCWRLGWCRTPAHP